MVSGQQLLRREFLSCNNFSFFILYENFWEKIFFPMAFGDGIFFISIFFRDK